MKTTNLNIRVTEDEKRCLNEIVSLLGEKNASSFIRNFINDLSSLMIYRNNDTDLNLLLEKYNSQLDNKNLEPYKKHSLKVKINMINQLIEEMKTLRH